MSLRIYFLKVLFKIKHWKGNNLVIIKKYVLGYKKGVFREKDNGLRVRGFFPIILVGKGDNHLLRILS